MQGQDNHSLKANSHLSGDQSRVSQSHVVQRPSYSVGQKVSSSAEIQGIKAGQQILRTLRDFLLGIMASTARQASCFGTVGTGETIRTRYSATRRILWATPLTTSKTWLSGKP